MSRVIIYPFKGYEMESNKIYFGWSQEQVKQQDGKPYKIEIDNIMNETYEYRMASIKLVYIDEKFESVVIPESPADNFVYIEGIPVNLFEKSSLEFLKQNYKYVESKDKLCINFMELGLILWGCGKKKSKEGKFVWAYSEQTREFYEDFVYC